MKKKKKGIMTLSDGDEVAIDLFTENGRMGFHGVAFVMRANRKGFNSIDAANMFHKMCEKGFLVRLKKDPERYKPYGA